MTQLAAVLATGNMAVVDDQASGTIDFTALPASVAARIDFTRDWTADAPFAGALIEGEADTVRQAMVRIAALPGPLVLAQAAASDAMGRPDAYCLHWLLEEVSTSINTAAAGGNASLMAIG